MHRVQLPRLSSKISCEILETEMMLLGYDDANYGGDDAARLG